MLPLLKPDDQVLAACNSSYAIGDIVIARHPYRSDVLWIKKLTEVDASGRVRLEGLNPEESTDSRTQGHVAQEHIIGRVVCRL